MRKLMAWLLTGMVLFVACGGDEDEPVTEASPTGAAEQPTVQDEYLIVDGGDPITFEESCVDTSGQYTGNLPDGGVFILRSGTAPDENFVDLLPSESADPLSSQEASDTTIASEGGFVTGSSTVYTEDGANSLELEFAITIEGAAAGC